jgi:hypothetical protein
MSNSFSYKITTESEQFTFDFSPVLGSSETISGATCVVQVKEGTDANPSNILVGTPSWIVSGTATQKAIQRIANGVDGVTYSIQMTVTTSLSNIYTVVGDLPVLAPINV